MGDEDEGFDEEFCDTDEPPAPLRPTPNDDLPPLNLQDLNNADFQTLLDEHTLGSVGGSDSVLVSSPFPPPSLLDDIDPGVYMLEAEQSTHSLLGTGESDIAKSPLHSPFPLSAPSPMCAAMTVGHGGVVSPSSLDDWNTSQFYPYHEYSTAAVSGGTCSSEYGSGVNVCTPRQYFFPPPSPNSLPASSPPPPTTSCFELDMLVSMCNDQQPSNNMAMTQLTPHSHSPVPSPHHSPVHSPHHHHDQRSTQSGFTTGTLVNYGGTCGSPSPGSSPHSTHVTSPTYHTNYGYNPLVNRQSTTQLVNGCTLDGIECPGSSPHGTQTNTNTRSEYTSSSTQIPIRAHQSPAPSNPALSTNTTDDIPKDKTPSTGDKMVHMPFYQFKKIIESPALPEEKKNNIKTLRRRGKNKIAAKTCRQRKMELVSGLQQEIEQLRAIKQRISGQTNTLQKEIELLKSQCTATYYHHKRQSSQHTSCC